MNFPIWNSLLEFDRWNIFNAAEAKLHPVSSCCIILVVGWSSSAWGKKDCRRKVTNCREPVSQWWLLTTRNGWKAMRIYPTDTGQIYMCFFLWHTSRSCHLKSKRVVSEMQTNSWEIIVEPTKSNSWIKMKLFGGVPCWDLTASWSSNPPTRPTMITTEQLTRTNRLIFLGCSKFQDETSAFQTPDYDQCHVFEKQVKTWGCKLTACLISFQC